MTLRPTTKRLKQLIREHGATGWTELRSDPVACFGGDDGVLIASPDGTHTRWVRPTDLEDR